MYHVEASFLQRALHYLLHDTIHFPNDPLDWELISMELQNITDMALKDFQLKKKKLY